MIGKAATGNNRFLIQEASEPQEPTPCQAVQFATLTTRVAVLDNGNVGIGTDAPDQLLTVANAGGDAFIHLKNGTIPSALYLGAGELGGVLATANTNDLRFRTGGTDPTDDAQTRMTIVSSGQIGIGTPTPDSGHHVTLHARRELADRAQGDHNEVLAPRPRRARWSVQHAGDDLRLGAERPSLRLEQGDGRVAFQRQPGLQRASSRTTGKRSAGSPRRRRREQSNAGRRRGCGGMRVRFGADPG